MTNLAFKGFVEVHFNRIFRVIKFSILKAIFTKTEQDLTLQVCTTT